MSGIADFPYFEVQFTKAGEVYLPSEVAALTTYLQQEKPSDLFVISHGWLTDLQGARHMYANFFEQVRKIVNNGSVPGIDQRQFAVLGVLWPSKKFADKGQTAGGAAGLEGSMQQTVEEELAGLEELLNDPKSRAEIAALKALIPQLEDSEAARTDFTDGVRRLLTKGAPDEGDGSEELFAMTAEEIMQNLSQPTVAEPQNGGEGGAADLGEFSDQGEGGAAGLFSAGGFVSAAADLLNLATYYEMKERAGTVGMKGLHPLLRTILSQNPGLKVHLVGHSFGGRVVSAAALGTGEQPPLSVTTLSLLQSAFSHYGFAKKFDGNKDGFFRKVIDNHCIAGATLITHTKNDTAVGIAYPIASALAKDNAAGLGDANDRYGAIGSNGALKTPEAISNLSLQPVGKPYKLTAGKLHNLRSDAFITSHGDICKPEVAYALLTAVAMS
ncbi:MAG: hypothetical protein ACK575_14035 [Cyanobacteriota bacterium]